jgi:DNA-binding response OmpR family regulator
MGCNILLVGGHELGPSALAERLALFGACGIDHAASGVEALVILAAGAFDIALIDSPLADLPAGDFCWLARRRGIRTLLLVMGQSSESETVLALESGADDYIARPYGISLLLARLRAHLRQRQLSGDIGWPGPAPLAQHAA